MTTYMRSPAADRAETAAAALLAIGIVLSAGCGGSRTGPPADSTSIPGRSTLVFQGSAAASPQRTRLEEIIRRTVTDARVRIDLDGITIIVRHGSSGGVIPQLGFGGRANAGTVTMTIDPDSPVWLAALETEFSRVLLHELHHVARFRRVGFNDNLLEAMVTEGLADQFMVELSGGEPPIWARALTGDELDTWLEQRTVAENRLPTRERGRVCSPGGSAQPRWCGYWLRRLPLARARSSRRVVSAEQRPLSATGQGSSMW